MSMNKRPLPMLVMASAIVLIGAAAPPFASRGTATAAGGAAVPAANRPPAFFSTFIGDETTEVPFGGAAVVIDRDNTIIVVGRTGSARFPVSRGAIKGAVTGASDIFITRFDAELKTLLSATLVGGTGDEGECAVTLGPRGDIYIAGTTTSKDFPPGAAMLDAGRDEAASRTFIARISGDLSKVVSSAVLSRESAPRTGATEIVYDQRRQRVLVGGTTASKGFPTTPGAVQTRIESGEAKKYVAIVDPDLTKVVSATLLGGSGREGAVNGLLTDGSGNVFVGGSTFSTDFPTTQRAFKRAVGPGQVWGVVSKLSPDLTSLLASTFVGETGNDFIYSIALDRRENVVFAGHMADAMPTTPNAYLRTNKGNPDVANVGVLSNDLSTLVASTFVCGGGEGSYYGGYSYFGRVLVDGAGTIFLTGTSDIPYYPTTPGAFDDSQNGARDVVVVRMNADLSSLEASTFLGGSGRDVVGRFALDRAGHLVVVGSTTSKDFPTTAGAFQTVLAERQTVYVAKLGADLADPEQLPAHAAARSGDLARLRALAQGEGAQLRRSDKYRRLPLHWAARFGQLDTVRWLAGQGADLNAQDAAGNAPLHLAALRGGRAAAELLLSSGADIDRANGDGDTPLHLASLVGHDQIVRLLVGRKATLDARNALGNTPLHRAVFSRHGDVVRTLLDGGANPSSKNGAGDTPLHLAGTVFRGDETVALLIKSGAPIDEPNARMQTPLHGAAGYSWEENALELLSAGPDVNRQDQDGRTPLHNAVSRDMRRVVQGLLARGADPGVKDKKGKSAVDLAEEAKMAPMVELLKGPPKK